MTFGERLRYLREERELRQQDVAKGVHVSVRMLGYYESDEHFPRDADMVIALAKFFNVSLDYLFGLSNLKNHSVIKKLNEEFLSLPEEKQSSVIDYVHFLSSEIKNDTKKSAHPVR